MNTGADEKNWHKHEQEHRLVFYCSLYEVKVNWHMPITYYTEEEIEQIKEQHNSALAAKKAEGYCRGAQEGIRDWIIRENLYSLPAKELR